MSDLKAGPLAELTDAQRGAIAEAAARRGFEAAFTDGPLTDAEVYFGANAEILNTAPSLRWLAVPSAGTDPYVGPVAARGNVMLTCSSGAYGVTIAEHVIMVTLEMMRQRLTYIDLIRDHIWDRRLPVRAIRGSRVTLLGTGDIGRELAIRLRAFGPAKIVGVNRSGKAAEGLFDEVCPISGLDEVLKATDLLIMSLPGTPETAKLMDDRRLRLLPEDAFLINVGRGNSIDQAALLEQLKQGRFAGVSLDVFEREPLPADDPAWECPRLLVTPHIAGNMTLPYTVERIVQLFLENFERYCDGQPLLRRVGAGRNY